MITLKYDTHEVQVAGPAFGDVLRQAAGHVLSTVKSGNVERNAANKAPYYSADYNIRGLCAGERDDLMRLIRAAIGQPILLTDYLGNEITCFISNEDIEVVTLRDGRHYDVRLQFMWA